MEYLLGEELGRGAWATVYRARHADRGGEVAIKLLRPESCLSESAVSRALREARLVAGLTHPNIVAVHDHGSFQGQPYIVMECVPGTTLEALLDGGRRMDPDVAVPIFTQVARALGCAHRAGIVHRDVKTGNILVMPRHVGFDAKLADFGIASAGSSDLTLQGAMIGTPAFMPPEQARGQRVDARADLYSLGAVMFRTLTGQLPFDRPHAIATVMGHILDPVPAFSEVAPELPPMPALEETVRRLLAKDPEERFASADALLDAL